MTEEAKNKQMLKGAGVSRTYGMKKRYAICKRCRQKVNIALMQDTYGGYFCPRCQKSRQERERRGVWWLNPRPEKEEEQQ